MVRRVVLLMGVAVLLSGCAADRAQTTSPSPSVTRPVDALVTGEELDDDVLLHALTFALERLLGGDDAAEFLTGDRLLVITPETFSEIPATGDGFLDAELSFGGGCPGLCSTSLRTVLAALQGDAESGATVSLEVPVASSMSSWPSVGVASQERSWRVSFGSDGTRLVAVEYFGPTPLSSP